MGRGRRALPTGGPGMTWCVWRVREAWRGGTRDVTMRREECEEGCCSFFCPRPFNDARFFLSTHTSPSPVMLRRAAAALAGRAGRLATASEAQV